MSNKLKDILKEVGEGYFGSYETETITEVTEGDLFDGFLFFDTEGEYDQEPNNVRERMYRKFIRKNFSSPTIERYMQREYDGWIVKP